MENKQLRADLHQIVKNHLPKTTADPERIIQTALAAYDNARTNGMCHEGAWEIALETLKNSP